MKIFLITQKEIDELLKAILSTNISWQTGESIKNFFAALPQVKEPETVNPTANPNV